MRAAGRKPDDLEVLVAESDAIDTSTPHPARRYNYWLGGKDNFAADRESGDQIAELFPTIRITARENRGFLRRATRFLTAEVGIRQFLDIGTGLPTAENTHEVAQAIAPESRIVYVDNDPLVMVHARALLNSSPEGRATYLEADLRDPDAILADADLAATLDFSRPVGLMLIAVLHFIADDAEAVAAVRRLVEALPSGSYLVASNATADFAPVTADTGTYEAMLASGKADVWPRDRARFEAFFAGLELVEPGVVCVSEWRADDEPPPRPEPRYVGVYGAVARVP
jgi:hypothetical protein